MRHATNLHEVTMPWLLPGLTLSSSPTDYQPIKQLRETRFNGKTWELLDELPYLAPIAQRHLLKRLVWVRNGTNEPVARIEALCQNGWPGSAIRRRLDDLLNCERAT
jgi:hypothetical protein